MTNTPLRRISISDYRRLSGNWQIPLDAPIVLLHGNNGAGKTSVLSAIELALTGEVKSMLRQDERYTAHLPTYGTQFATLDIEIELPEQMLVRSGPMTVGGNHVDGSPALDSETARHFAERCYLDQTSLSRLLELYQHREGQQESALAKFVNELLGLDRLDSLRSGLSAATDVRRLRKLSNRYGDTEQKAKQAGTNLDNVTRQLDVAEANHESVRSQLNHSLIGLGLSPDKAPTLEDEVLAYDAVESAQADATQLVQLLTELRGRVLSLTSKPSADRFNAAEEEAYKASEAWQEWQDQFQEQVDLLNKDISAANLTSQADTISALDFELGKVTDQLVSHDVKLAELADLVPIEQSLTAALADLDSDVTSAETHAGHLASSLASLQEHVVDNICPVCDRDYAEVGDGGLATHVAHVISQLTDRGQELLQLASKRDAAEASLNNLKNQRSSTERQIHTEIQLASLTSRQLLIESLLKRFQDLELPMRSGSTLRRANRDAQEDVADRKAHAAEVQNIRAQLSAHARSLDAPHTETDDPLDVLLNRLLEVAKRKQTSLKDRQTAISEARRLIGELEEKHRQVTEFEAAVTAAAKSRQRCDDQLAEMARRRSVAQSVHSAASETRSNIVQRVFTESLNSVWRDVFSRLAPREQFVPAFGIPTSTKTALELDLQTIHSSGGLAGKPSVMLSAGNLNTAALSLFIALHLAVEPLFPCLVFDDPVQSMDEVHVAQFAGLMRVLSKEHKRQIVIAVHEQELFDYLALELSPAYEGDKLITIELGGSEERCKVEELTWAPDAAIAM